MSIKAVVFCRFDPQEGPKVVHQVPEESIITLPENISAGTSIPPASSSTPPLLSFPSISRFLIPRQSLCGNLISVRPPALTPQSPPCLILTHPICISSPQYPRNEFIFSFSLVLAPPDSIDVPAYKSVVTKLAHLMRSLESQSQFLSSDSSTPNTGKVYSLCEMLMEDLNNYCECMIPIDELNTLNIKLFPTLPNPPSVKAWHVPLLTVRIETLMDENWDLTMQRIIPFMDGVNSVKKIAGLADADLKLTKKCVKHLIFYGCVLLLDVFSFNAIYVPTSSFGEMIAQDMEMQRECARYVNMAFAPGARNEVGFSSVDAHIPPDPRVGSSEELWPLTGKGQIVDGAGIVQLFASLRQGLDVRGWYTQNANMLANIDMRRFLTFGVIKGFLCRVHKYPYGTGIRRDLDLRRNSVKKAKVASIKVNGTDLPRSMSSELHLGEDGHRHAKRLGGHRSGDEDIDGDDEDRITDAMLRPYLDGTHCFDEICTDLEISERDLQERLRKDYEEEVIIVSR